MTKNKIEHTHNEHGGMIDCKGCELGVSAETAEKKEMALVSSNSAEALMSQAINKGVDVGTMERLLVMRRELKAEAAKEAYNTAMSEFQSDCPTIQKTKQVMNKDGRTVRYKFAPIDIIVNQVKPVIQKHGFSYTVDAQVEPEWVTAICKVTHELGHSETSSFKVPIEKESYMNAAQKFASALTFAKRYAFCNAFGILTGDEDDDTQVIQVAEKVQKNSDKFVEWIGRATLLELSEYKEKIIKTDKYTPEQKKEMVAAIEKRAAELTK